MITPVITIRGEALDLGVNSSLTLVRKNPLLEKKQGSFAYPIQIPPSARNQRLLNHPERLQRTERLNNKINAVLIMRYGISCSITVDSVTKEGYSITIAGDSGTIYDRVGTKKLADFDWPVENYSTVDDLLNHLDKCLNGIIETNYKIAPIVVDKQNNSPYLLNEFEITSDSYNEQMVSSLKRNTVDKIDEYYVNNPVGYRISPFLKLTYVLKNIFRNVQLPLKYDVIPHISPDAVILNNVCDSAVRNKLSYAQLLPNITAAELIGAVEDMFCGRFIVCDGQLEFVLFKEVYLTSPHIDLSEIAVSEPTIDYQPFRQLVIKQKKSIKGSDNKDFGFKVNGLPLTKFLASETSFETFNEFYANSKPQSISRYYNIAYAGIDGERYCQDIGLVLRINKDGVTPISSIFFDYKAPTVDDYADDVVNILSEALPLAPYEIKRYEGGDKDRQLLEPIPIPVFSVGRSTPNTKVVGAKTSEKDSKCPLCICNAFTVVARPDEQSGYDEERHGTFATPLNYNPYTRENQQTTSFVVSGKYGLFNSFFREYSDFLKNSNQTFRVKVRDDYRLFFYKNYTILGQPVIIREIKQNSSANYAELTLSTIKNYLPLTKEDNTHIDL